MAAAYTVVRLAKPCSTAAAYTVLRLAKPCSRWATTRRLHCSAPSQTVLHGCRLHRRCAWPNRALGCPRLTTLLNEGPALIPNDAHPAQVGLAEAQQRPTSRGKTQSPQKTSPIEEGWLSLLRWYPPPKLSKVERFERAWLPPTLSCAWPNRAPRLPPTLFCA